jgi:hypothetical protein
MTGPELIAFIDSNIKANEKGKPFTLSDHQRVVIGLMWGQHYSIRLWSEIKKSGKTFLAACVCLAEAYSNQSIEIICLANDLEQSTGRVFQTCVDLIKYNIALTRSARVLNLRSGLPTAAPSRRSRPTTRDRLVAGRSWPCSTSCASTARSGPSGYSRR